MSGEGWSSRRWVGALARQLLEVSLFLAFEVLFFSFFSGLVSFLVSDEEEDESDDDEEEESDDESSDFFESLPPDEDEPDRLSFL